MRELDNPHDKDNVRLPKNKIKKALLPSAIFNSANISLSLVEPFQVESFLEYLRVLNEEKFENLALWIEEAELFQCRKLTMPPSVCQQAKFTTLELDPQQRRC